MRVNVDYERCTGHGICESLAGDIFEVGSDGMVHLLIDDLAEARRSIVESAVGECPTQALSLGS